MDGDEVYEASREAYERFFDGKTKVFTYLEMEHAFKSGAEWMKDRIVTMVVRTVLVMLALMSVLCCVFSLI